MELASRKGPSVRIKWGNRLFVTTAISLIALALAGCGETGNQGSYDIPAFGERLMYISGVDGYLYAIDREFKHGNRQDNEDLGWRQPVGDEFDLKPLVAGPALHPDPDLPIIIVGSEDGKLYFYDADLGGNALGSFTAAGKIWSTPVIKDGTVYFGSHDKNVYAVNVVDRTAEWKFATGGPVAGRPLLFNDLVVVGSFDKNLYGLEAKSGDKRWEIKGTNWFWAGAVANESTIFAPNMDGNIYAIDKEGKLLWKYDLGSPIVSRPALVPNALVVAAKNGRQISLLDTNTSTTNRLIDSEFVTNSEIKAPIFVHGNTIYVGTQDSTIIRLDIFTDRAGRPNLEEAWCWDTKSEARCE